MPATRPLRTAAYNALVEATRRYSRFHFGCPLTKAWTGLGSATAYREAVQAGLMEIATQPNPGYMTWWRLTERGAGIVQAWLGAGYRHDKIECGELPPYPVVPVASHCGASSCFRQEAVSA
jgi:hypothetical protein